MSISWACRVEVAIFGSRPYRSELGLSYPSWRDRYQPSKRSSSRRSVKHWDLEHSWARARSQSTLCPGGLRGTQQFDCIWVLPSLAEELKRRTTHCYAPRRSAKASSGPDSSMYSVFAGGASKLKSGKTLGLRSTSPSVLLTRAVDCKTIQVERGLTQ
jgi:hypothetical protein